MAFSIKLIRRPRSVKRVTKSVQDEIRKTYDELATKSIEKLEFNIMDWDKKPKFKSRISISDKEWKFSLGYDSKTEAGQHYKWVDEGTGSRGGGEDYIIRPKKKGGFLVFTYPPHIPKSVPTPYVPGLVKGGPAILQHRKSVTAKGIYPRNFSKELEKFLKNREQVGGFRSVTEAAIKRAFRKEGIYK